MAAIYSCPPGVRPRHRHDLVDHDPADLAQTVALRWLDDQAKERRLGLVGRESAEGYRVGTLEGVFLNDYSRPRLTHIFRATGYRPG